MTTPRTNTIGETLSKHDEHEDCPPVGSDRELLELAAKAAGVEYNAEESKPHPKSGAFWGLWLVFHDEPSEYDRRYWNPLTDDGDALRLAVKMGLDLMLYGDTKSAHPGSRGPMAGERSGSDPLAATRRAIVRAAAAIARTTGANL